MSGGIKKNTAADKGAGNHDDNRSLSSSRMQEALPASFLRLWHNAAENPGMLESHKEATTIIAKMK